MTHIQQIDEEVSAEYAWTIGKDAVLATVEVGAQYTHTAHQHGHFRCG